MRLARAIASMALVLLAGAVASCHRDHGGFVDKRGEESCLRSRGCPPVQTLPPCAPDLDVRMLADVLAHQRELVDQAVTVRGPLVRGNGNCTERGCAGGGCCNRCGASLQLGVGSPGQDVQQVRARTLQLFGRLGCRGDESLLCCDVDVSGQEAIARGRLRLMGTTWAIEPAELCAPPSPAAPGS